MSGSEFRKWIEAGYKNYGKDPWFFIRELAQNSRDAGAKTIHVKAGRTAEKNEILIFEDDGRGMSYSHAKRFLFRLYASSKNNEKYSAGMFGIGFWTVLKFNPSKIIIESSVKDEKWAVMVDGDLKTTRIASGLTANGTRITLVRTPQEASAGVYLRNTREAVMRYCSYLRRNDRRAEPLPVLFLGENITRKMKLPGPVALSFKRGAVEGAVGLGPKPSVQLYARGLPVWEGTTLEELSHTPPIGNERQHQEFGQGLAPVFLLNGNNLEVNISRKKVIDNRQLQQVRKTAEKVLTQMVQMAADCISPRNLLRRFRDKFDQIKRTIFRSFSKTFFLLLIIIIPLEIIFLTSIFKFSPKSSAGSILSIRTEKRYYSGASVRTATAGNPLDLTYHPPANRWFKLFTADDYRIDSGFSQAADKPKEVPFPSVHCSEDPISIELKISETGRIYLPQPAAAGFSIDPASITINRRGPVSARYHSNGEVVLNLPDAGIIRYQCCPVNEEPLLSPDQHKRLTQFPQDLLLAPSVEKELRESLHLPVHKKVEKALRLTVKLLKYDDSAKTAKKYARSTNRSNWLQKVITIGAGDCDILNGVTALFLRKMGVPARLVIGLIGRKGKILPGMHAWTEYYAGGPHITDATARTSGLWEAEYSKQRTGAAKTGSESDWSLSRHAFIFLLGGAILLLLFFFFFFVSRNSKERKPLSPKVLTRVEESLAGIALHSLLHPGAWGRGSSIRDLKLIPTIDNRFVSLREALKLGKDQKLFTADSTNPLVPYLEQTSKSVPLLDSGNSAFAPLIKLLPGAVQLEKIAELKAIPPGKAADGSIGQLLTAVNRRLKANIPPLLLAPGLDRNDDDFFDADLSPLPLLSVFGLPRRFIAVNPNSSQVKTLAALFQKNSQLAQFRLINAVFKESSLAPFPSAGIIEKVSHRLLEEIQ